MFQDRYRILNVDFVVRFDSKKIRALFKKRYGGFFIREGMDNETPEEHFITICDNLKLDINGKITSYPDIDKLFNSMEQRLDIFLGPVLFPYERFHAAAAYHSINKGMMISAPGGGGKTTLARRLTEKGFKFLSDDVTIVEHKTLQIVPFPRALKILRDTGKPLYLNIEELYPSSIGVSCLPRYLIFLEQYHDKSNENCVVEQISNSEAFIELFKFRIADETTDFRKSVATIANLANSTISYRLIPGRLEDVINCIIKKVRGR